MSTKIEFTARIITDEGAKDIVFTSSQPIPEFEDFEELGFAKAFDALETAVLTARKESSESIIAEYINENSKKNTSQECRNSANNADRNNPG